VDLPDPDALFPPPQALNKSVPMAMTSAARADHV
jgi:hypothetical protein